jgi:kumamolisin
MWGGNIGSELGPPTLLWFLIIENMIAGGGYSLLVPAPSYQQGLVPLGAGRDNPDFSFPASVVTFAYFDGTSYFLGGISASAPLFSGWVGDLDLAVGSSLGNVNPMIYGMAQKDPGLLMPVAYGNNGVYSVTPGYNAATGLSGS